MEINISHSRRLATFVKTNARAQQIELMEDRLCQYLASGNSGKAGENAGLCDIAALGRVFVEGGEGHSNHPDVAIALNPHHRLPHRHLSRRQNPNVLPPLASPPPPHIVTPR